ncbi:MAG: anhydro-N-acetylmuramic acid kinase [Nitrospinae bacterium]|nr:anhydro-N-acetylmuramic acid kinase [Nitrospinota bacterium]
MKTVLGIGLMSGTSGDGVDSALVRFKKGKPELLATAFLPYPDHIRENVFLASLPDGTASLICRLNAELGKMFGEAAAQLCKKAKTPLKKIDFIGSHGQTIRHQPSANPVEISSTLQIGDGAEIARITGRTVVSDFRTADIAAGGQGAPLAPLAHHAMFADKKEDRVIHNLGGISNVTWLPAGGGLEDVRGFDTGPANMLIDLATAHFSKGKQVFDKDGKIALKGKLNAPLFDHCMKHPFFKRRPPKSTGREMFGKDYYDAVLEKFAQAPMADFLRTLCAVTAQSAVSQALAHFAPEKKVRWVVCGGGAFNKALMAELKERLKGRGQLALSSDLGFGEKSVEAVLMAVLAWRTLNGLPGNLPQVTGARSPALLGKISPA